ncbi:MAG: hypothetical protein EU529_07825 [Promethearchaeota archaeon]|nr:MAG: hypothetical protein EU529_07825 [Candidatus Lokiarchaeota archaeon]
MIFQGLFNILDLYSNEIDLFYDAINKYFRERIIIFIDGISLEKRDLAEEYELITSFLTKELINLGFEREEFEYKFSDEFIKIRKKEINALNTPIERFDKKLAPIVYEIFLEKVVDYLVDKPCIPIMLELRSRKFIPIEFLMELRNLKNLFDKDPDKLENLKKYVQIRERIIQKFSENKEKIEKLEDLDNPQDKLQLIYLIYRIIDFFHLQKIFDFSHIKNFLKNNIEEWLVSIPLVTLKNPDLYFCGIYLANRLLDMDTDINKEQVINFLLNLYEENIDEFEASLFEATDRIYYFLKATQMSNYRLSDSKIKMLLKTEPRFFESHFLKNLETSQLVVILKILNLVGFNKLEREIQSITEEIERRITPEGIIQYRDGFVTSESTYYVLFCNYMKNSLDKLKDNDLLGSIVSRIYRNLEILDFSVDTNYDLVSELFYSIESLKLFNCIETKQMIIHLTKYLFPQIVVDTILKSEEITQTTTRFRHLKVNRITGETIY